MKILFFQEQPCIRTFKYAKGLRFFYNEIVLNFGYIGETLNGFYGYGDELFDGWFKIRRGAESEELKSIVSRTNPDVIHCHNAPDSLTVACIHNFGGKFPIVHDVHDLLTVRNTKYDDGIEREIDNYTKISQEERIALENSDGIVAVSESILKLASKKYNLDSQKSLVFPNFIVGDMVPRRLKNKLSADDGMLHIVYEGHLDGTRSGGHYDLLDIFTVIALQGIHVHIYPSRENELYKNLAEVEKLIHYHGRRQPIQLMEELTQYDLGWAGFNTTKNSMHTDTVLTNKLFDYIGAGLPVLSFAHKSQKRFLESNGLGIIINDPNELDVLQNSSHLNTLMNNVKQKRFSFTMETQIVKVHEFYQNVMAFH